MWKLQTCLFFFLFLHFSIAQRSWRTGPRVLGGRDAELGEFPYQLLLQTLRNEDWRCGASILSRKVAVTAAHCLRERQNGLYYVTAGVFDLRYPGDYKQTLNVTDMVLHPGYNSDTLQNDIALILLAEPGFTFGTNVAAIEIHSPKSTRNMTSSTKLTASGFGLTQAFGEFGSNILQKIRFPVVPNTVCQSVYINDKPPFKIFPSVICAGDPNEHTDTCRGDSGGPLVLFDEVLGHLLVGITSYGPKPCGRVGWPGVYTRVSHFAAWVKEQEARLDPDADPCGGFIKILDGQPITIRHKNFRRQNITEVCVWTVVSSTENHILKFNLTSWLPRNSSGKLKFQDLGARNSATVPKMIGDSANIGLEKTSGKPAKVTVLSFTSTEGQEFSMEIRSESPRENPSKGTRKNKRKKTQTVFLTPEFGRWNNLSYPASKFVLDSQYGRNVDHSFLLRGRPGQFIQLSILSLDTEETFDPLTVYQFSKAQNIFLLQRILSGNRGQLSNLTFVGGDGEPFLLNFNSDESIQGDGFNFTYAYIDAAAKNQIPALAKFTETWFENVRNSIRFNPHFQVEAQFSPDSTTSDNSLFSLSICLRWSFPTDFPREIRSDITLPSGFNLKAEDLQDTPSLLSEINHYELSLENGRSKIALKYRFKGKKAQSCLNLPVRSNSPSRESAQSPTILVYDDTNGEIPSIIRIMTSNQPNVCTFCSSAQDCDTVDCKLVGL